MAKYQFSIEKSALKKTPAISLFSISSIEENCSTSFSLHKMQDQIINFHTRWSTVPSSRSYSLFKSKLFVYLTACTQCKYLCLNTSEPSKYPTIKSVIPRTMNFINKIIFKLILFLNYEEIKKASKRSWSN